MTAPVTIASNLYDKIPTYRRGVDADILDKEMIVKDAKNALAAGRF